MRSCQTALFLAVSLSLGTASSAVPFDIASSLAGTAAGNYGGQTFTVNDASHAVTGTNSCSVGDCALIEWSWRLGDPQNPGVSAGSLYIDIYDLTGGVTYLGSSTNAIDVQNTGVAGQFLTWTFDAIQVDPTHLLIAEVSFDDASGNAAVIRLDAAPDNVAGNLFNGGVVDTGFDSVYSATFVPEPGTGLLLGLGLAGLAGAGRRSLHG